MHLNSRLAFLSLLVLSPFLSRSEEIEKKHRLYFEWGYNRDWYSKSTITFKGPENPGMPYDFVVYDLKATDEFRGDRLATAPMVPQYSYRIGYMFNVKKGLGIEFNFDHSKYVVTPGQTAHATGSINDVSFNGDTLIGEPFLMFEHTNGANFAMLNFVRERTFHASANKNFSLVHTLKAGAGVVIPKTYVLINHEHLDNEFHVAGFVTGIETGVKAFYKKHVYLNLAGKFCYADYYNALGLGDGKISHHFFATEALITIGYQISL